MIEARLLGQRSVLGADGSEALSVSAQPKRLGLLVYVTLARAGSDGYVSRDEVLATFWPESDIAHARNTLNQHLFRLRSSLGSEVILSRGASLLGVNFDVLWCDAIEFAATIQTGDHERALELYKGSLLPGFHLSGTPGFERWLDTQRLSLRQRALEAALALAAERGASQPEQAELWFRRAIEIAPASEKARHGLIATLAAGGDRSRALQEFRSFERWLRKELGTQPTAEMRALADSLQASDSTPPADPGAPTMQRTVSAVAALGDRLEPLAAEPVGQTSPRGSLDRLLARAKRVAVPSIGIALLALVSSFFLRQQAAPVESRETLNRVAVLPLQNHGDTPDQLVEAIHDDLTRRLGEVSALEIPSRAAVLRFRDSSLSIEEYGGRLGVDALLVGSVFGTDSLVRLGFSLFVLDPHERRLWDRSYVEEVRDILNLDSRVVLDVARAIRVTATAAERVRLTRDRSVVPEAFKAYSFGIHHLLQQNPDGLNAAIDYLERAISLEPNNALYHSALAQALYLAGTPHGDRDPEEAWARAKQSSLKAVALDETLAEAHAALAGVLNYHDSDLAGAERAFRRAIELNPSSASAHWGLGALLNQQFRIEEALTELRIAQRLEPFTPIISGDVAVALYYLGRYDEAIDNARRSIDVDSIAPSLWVLGEAYSAKGMHEEAIAAHERAVAINPAFSVFLVHSYAAAGRRGDAEKLFEEVKTGIDRERMEGAYGLGLGYAVLDQPDSALAWLETAAAQKMPFLNSIRYMPHFDGLRDAPRFQAILAGIEAAGPRTD